MQHFKLMELGKDCTIETARLMYGIAVKQNEVLQERNNELVAELAAKEAEIQKLKADAEMCNHNLWAFFKSLSRFDSVSFTDESDEFEKVLRHQTPRLKRKA